MWPSTSVAARFSHMARWAVLTFSTWTTGPIGEWPSVTSRFIFYKEAKYMAESQERPDPLNRNKFKPEAHDQQAEYDALEAERDAQRAEHNERIAPGGGRL